MRNLGFDERGAWVLSNYRGVYVWSFKTWKLEYVANRLSNVPREALQRLHNPDHLVTEAIAAARSPKS